MYVIRCPGFPPCQCLSFDYEDVQVRLEANEAVERLCFERLPDEHVPQALEGLAPGDL